MLMMLPNRMRVLPIDKIFPFNDDDLMIAVSDRLIFGLRDIRDEAGNLFSIRKIVESEQKIFGKQPFRERNRDFTGLLFTRLERYFVTKKSDYIYFDLTEQEYLRDKIFMTNSLTAKVEIYLIDEGKFIPIDFEQMSMREFKAFKNGLTEIGAIVGLPPNVYVMMNEKVENYDKFNRDRMKQFKVDVKLEKIFKKYPYFKDCKTIKEFNSIYRTMAKDLHPDRNHKVDPKKFAEFQVDVDYIKKSKWYRGLL